MGKTSLEAKACSVSFARQSTQVWALDPLSFSVCQPEEVSLPSTQVIGPRKVAERALESGALVLMGCSILDMLYQLDLSPLEVLFVYIVKMSQKKRGRLVEWVEKASFARLNKLFEISTSKPVLKEAKSFILPILHHLAPRSNVHPPTKKKKGHVIQPVQRARTLPSASPSSPSTSFSSPSSSSSATSTESDIRVDLSTANTKLETGVELVVLLIACEEEEEKDMVANLRIEFKERQHKRLSESITVVSPPSKRPYLEPLYLEPVLAIASTLAPSTAIASNNLELERGLSQLELLTKSQEGPYPTQNTSVMTPLSAWLPSFLIPSRIVPQIGRR
ncbi:hypothetical protein AAG906_035535 [Vitis piasezkii]